MFVALLKRRTVRIAIYLVGIALSVSLAQSIIAFWQRGAVVTEEEKRLNVLEKRNNELKKQLEETYKPSFIEGEAREKLNMSKPGEYVAILPLITPVLTPTPSPELETWQQWMKLFRL